MSSTIRLLLGLPLALLAACTISPPLAPYMALKQRCDRDAGAWFQAMHPAGVSHETVDTALRTADQVDECRVLEKTCGSSDEWQRLVIAAWER